ncbi:MAG: cytochrome c [Nitrospiraceae bacterium]
MRKFVGFVVILFLLFLGLLGWFGYQSFSTGFSAKADPNWLEIVVARQLRYLAIPLENRNLRNPVPLTPDVMKEARAHFADHCASCHANDGSGQTKMGQNFYPKTPDLRLSNTQDMSDGEMFFIIQNGIRFTGMPAWGTGDPSEDTDSWKLVHFIRHLPRITEKELEEMKTLNPKTKHELEEEEANERFLRGEDDGPAAPSSHRH